MKILKGKCIRTGWVLSRGWLPWGGLIVALAGNVSNTIAAVAVILRLLAVTGEVPRTVTLVAFICIIRFFRDYEAGLEGEGRNRIRRGWDKDQDCLRKHRMDFSKRTNLKRVKMVANSNNTNKQKWYIQ